MIIITIFTIILAIALKTQISPIQFTRLAALSLLLSSFLSFNVLYTESLGSGLGMFSGLFQVSSLSQGLETFIFVVASLILIPWFISPSHPASRGEGHKQSNNTLISGPILSEYPLIILFSVLGASLLISSADLISMYLSIELQSFAVYILATLHRDSEGSTSAGLKYFLLGGLSSCFILLGSALIYALTGLTNLESIFSLVFSLDLSPLQGGEGTTGENVTISIIGLLFIVIGFLFKIAAAPLHNWAPDVYDEVPSIVTTWLTIMPKISIVIFLLDLVTSTITGAIHSSLGGEGWAGVPNTWSLPLQNLFLISSLLSLVIGSVVGLAQYKIKRLLAYSTISHVGFLLLALGINTEQSTESLIFYILQYSITNLDTFLVLLALGYAIKAGRGFTPYGANSMDIRYISELKAQFVSNPLLTLSLALCLFSMAGIPPLVGFFAKQQILYSASYSGYYFMTVVAILVSVISCSYYLQIIKVMHFSPNLSIDTNDKGKEGDTSMISNTHSVLISILTLSIMLFILNPNIILNSTHLLALTIFNT